MAGKFLGDVADIVMGQSPPGEAVTVELKGLPLLNGPTEFGAHHPSPVQYTTDIRKKAHPGDVLFCVRGSTTGRMNWADREYAIGRGLASIRHKSDPRLQPLVRAVIEYSLADLLAQATGSTFPNVSFAQLSSVSFPSLDEDNQLAVAQMFGVFDSKIELNRRMSETLEATTQAIFKSWFVDFDPVYAKAAGKKPVGMDTETATLFPDSFEGSELGKIPKGWRVGVFSELIDSLIGGDWGKDAPVGDETEPVLCIRGADVPSLQTGGLGKMPKRYLKASSLVKRRLEHGDLVIEISGGSPTQSTGRPVFLSKQILDRLNYPVVCSNFCRGVKLKSAFLSKFVYVWLRTLYANDEFLQYENGTTGIKNLAFAEFSKKFKFIIPSDVSIKAFDKIVTPMFERQQAGGAESLILASLRDALLPKLMSGEIRILNTKNL